MAYEVRVVEYFYAAATTAAGDGLGVLGLLADDGVNLLAINTIPMGPTHLQLVLFPEDVDKLVPAAEKAGLTLTGPQRALLIQGDDEVGMVAGIHHKLLDVGAPVYASSGIADGRGHFGYLVHVRPDQLDAAARALGADVD